MKKWKFTKKIEDMSPEETRERIRAGYEFKMPSLFIMPYLGSEEKVTYNTKDFCARCPATGIADVYDLTISFIPDRKIPELKSLKLYFFLLCFYMQAFFKRLNRIFSMISGN